jgi:hypothetical protein
MFLILRFLWKKRTIITKMQRYVLIHAFVWISLIAVLNDNIGTATRLRPVAWILILVVFASLYSKNIFYHIMSRGNLEETIKPKRRP